MDFGKIIREAGINPEDFPIASRIPVIVTDRKGHVEQGNDIHFAKPLFAECKAGFETFERYLDFLENCWVQELRVKIDIDYVVILEYNPWCRNHTFWRKEW